VSHASVIYTFHRNLSMRKQNILYDTDPPFFGCGEWCISYVFEAPPQPHDAGIVSVFICFRDYNKAHEVPRR
jgi:hypothetical protein